MRQCKQKPCKVCKNTFQPRNSLQRTCDYKCAQIAVQEANDKKAARVSKEAERAGKRDRAARKVALKSKSDWLREAQKEFNAYIRARDEGNLCISCGKSKEELKINHMIQMVCGHYLSVGAHAELRFNPLNANLQCTRCNGGAGKYGNFNNRERTITQKYKLRLIDKIGQDKVDWLNGKQEIQKYTIDDIIEIKQYYKQQLNLLEGKQ